ncbi:RecE family exodeoxyribonuclease [Salmonella enterica]|uniref:RecE family exodeoxyribonuclease n=1 Tax=Salmonella enterica TaxID=28901 RepID=UPI0009AC580E|nr:RecE family exodeoxyribonuclease [Salmonella enterica]
MKNITQLVFNAKKSAIAKGIARAGTIWFDKDDHDEIDALSTLAIKEAGFKRSDFFNPVRVDHLIVDDMPTEGVFDTAFCDRYSLAENGKSWLFPTVEPESADAGTATASTPASDVNVNGEHMAEVETLMDWPVTDLPLPVRWISQVGMDNKVLTLSPAERERLTKMLEVDDDQHLTNIREVTSSEMAPEIGTLTLYHLYRLVTAFDKVSEKVERMGPCMAKRFVRAWLDTQYIDQGILVNEWCAGRHVSRIEKPTATSASEIPAAQKKPTAEAVEAATPRRSEKPTHRTINIEIASALIPEADPCGLRSVLNLAKDIIHSDREEWKRWSATISIIPDIKTYSRQTIFDMVRKAPAAVHDGSPELRHTWCESFLAIHGVRDPDWYEHAPDKAPTTHEENSETVRRAGKCLRDIEAGRFQSEEETQPTEVLADEQAAAETMEQDSTEHHQNPRQVDTESYVTRDSENGTAASNEGEKKESTLPGDVNQNQEDGSIASDSPGQIMPGAQQNPPQMQQTAPEPQPANPGEKPEGFLCGNDGRTTKKESIFIADNETERALMSSPAEGLTSEVVLWQQANQTLLQILASQLRIEQNHRKNAAAIKGMLAMIYDAETDEGITHGE